MMFGEVPDAFKRILVFGIIFVAISCVHYMYRLGKSYSDVSPERHSTPSGGYYNIMSRSEGLYVMTECYPTPFVDCSRCTDDCITIAASDVRRNNIYPNKYAHRNISGVYIKQQTHGVTELKLKHTDNDMSYDGKLSTGNNAQKRSNVFRINVKYILSQRNGDFFKHNFSSCEFSNCLAVSGKEQPDDVILMPLEKLAYPRKYLPVRGIFYVAIGRETPIYLSVHPCEYN